MDIDHIVFVEELREIISEPIKIVGNPQTIIKGLSPSHGAGIADLTFCMGVGVEERVLRTTAIAVLITEETYSKYNLPEWKTYILVRNPRLAFIECLRHYFPDNEPKDYLPIDIDDSVSINYGVVMVGDIKIGKNVKIGAHTVIGGDGFGFEKNAKGEQLRFPHFGGVVIEDDVEIGANVCIDRGTFGNTVIGKGTKIDNLVHVAHNVQLGKNCMVVAHAMIAGSVKIGDNSWIASSYIRDGITIGKDATIGLGAVVVKDVPDGVTVIGIPAKPMEKKI